MDTINTQTLLEAGNLYTLADGLTPDRREDFVAINHDVREPDAALVILAVGAATIVIMPNRMLVNVHDHPNMSHEECWQQMADAIRNKIAEHNAAMIPIREDETAQALLAQGMPAELVFMFRGHHVPDDTGLF